MVWPGYVGYHRTNSHIFGGLYMGSGCRSQDLPFIIWGMILVRIWYFDELDYYNKGIVVGDMTDSFPGKINR